MKKIERHTCGYGEGMFDNPKGFWVRYEDVIELLQDIKDIIDSENSGLSHQQRLNEIRKLIT